MVVIRWADSASSRLRFPVIGLIISRTGGSDYDFRCVFQPDNTAGDSCPLPAIFRWYCGFAELFVIYNSRNWKGALGRSATQNAWNHGPTRVWRIKRMKPQSPDHEKLRKELQSCDSLIRWFDNSGSSIHPNHPIIPLLQLTTHLKLLGNNYFFVLLQYPTTASRQANHV